MAIQGNFITTVYGITVTIPNQYMRFGSITISNDYIPVTGNLSLTKVVNVTGMLSTYALASDVASGLQPIATKSYTCPYDSIAGAALPEEQLYAYLMSLIEFKDCVAA